MTLLHALDGWETHRRSQLGHQSGSLEERLEQDRQRTYEASREIVLRALELIKVTPGLLDDANALAPPGRASSLPSVLPVQPCLPDGES